MSKTPLLDRVFEAIRNYIEAQRRYAETKRLIPVSHPQALVEEAERSLQRSKEQLQFALDSYIDYRITILMKNSHT